MDLTNYITQEIADRETALGIAKQKVVITSIKIDWQKLGQRKVEGLPQIIVEYEMYITSQQGQQIPEMRSDLKPRVFTNNDKLYQRSFDPDTLFQPLPNPDFVEGESPEDQRFLTMGAFDFVMGELALKNPQYLIPFLKMYILDNYEDGWYEELK